MSPRIKQWKNLAADYQLATGIPCRVLLLSESEHTPCPVCRDISTRYGIETHCDQVHLFSTYQSERWGGRYIYQCPLSALHWSSPLMEDGMMSGALIAGPAMLNKIDNLTLNSITQRFDMEKGWETDLEKLFLQIVSVTPEKTRSLSEILYAQAMSGSDRRDTAIFEDQESFHNESRIGEYIHFLKSMEGDKNSDLEYPIELEKKLLSCVARGDKDKAQKVLNELMAKVMYATGVDLDIIRSRILELVVLISRAALEGGADVEQIFGLNYRYLNTIRLCKSTDELRSWLGRIINRFGDLVFDLNQVKHTDTILRALRFIRENFFEKLTLADVAGQVGLSPDYFGKLFRSEVKHPFSEYLNRLRVEEAKRLLKSGKASLGDIAYACGFEDQSYFTRVFRKSVGTTPSRYRDADRIFLNRDDDIHGV